MPDAGPIDPPPGDPPAQPGDPGTETTTLSPGTVVTLLDDAGDPVAQLTVAADGSLWAADAAGGNAVNLTAASYSATAPRTWRIGGVTVDLSPGGPNSPPTATIRWPNGTGTVQVTIGLDGTILLTYPTASGTRIIITAAPDK